jgi:hypothetical protein
VSDVEIDEFLGGPQNPERDALLRVIGASMVNPQRAEAEDELAAEAGREWSDAEKTELGNMLVRGLPIEEIARQLRRDHREVRDKVAEVGRGLSMRSALGSCASTSAQVFAVRPSGRL